MHEKQDKVSEISVHSAELINRDTTYLSFTYGSSTMLKLEEMKVSELRDHHILAREMPVIKMNGEQHKDFTKVVSTKNSDEVKFLMSGGGSTVNKKQTPATRGEKRRNEGKQSTEQSLEERLALLKPSTGGSDKTDSYAKLLVQGLQSNNQNILMSVLDREDPHLVESSVKSLPVEYVVPLLEVLHNNIQSKSFSVSHVIWAQSLVRHHVGFLVSSPHVQQDILLPLSDLITARTANFLSVIKLKGKIEMIKNQMERNRNQGVEADHPPQVVLNDDSDDEEDNNTSLLPPRADYDSDFLDEYLSEEDSSSSGDEDDLENGEGGGSSSDEAEIMETENGTAMVNGHDSDDMDED